MTNIGWKFYYVFIVCNFTNALFFWVFLPETSKRPLEEMNYLFENAPWIVVGVSRDVYVSGDLERRVEDIAREKGIGDVRVERIQE
jgi:hypothetical protein